MRGTLERWRTRIRKVGIIPACAGNTIRLAWIVHRPRDHPRVCGEHRPRLPTWWVARGSSPRVRGTPSGSVGGVVGAGIIPACAGNTKAKRGDLVGWRDHPRVCGEHSYAVEAMRSGQGSSPRVRGTLFVLSFFILVFGIIPACAGNTTSRCKKMFLPRDHPRVCGEHMRYLFDPMNRQGSSPRVRGTPGFVDASLDVPGIIPACAGNTRSMAWTASRSRDHPRVCGEHTAHHTRTSDETGSSPRVRGTLALVQQRDLEHGIIPACAGNTMRLLISRARWRDHPRVCGEHDESTVEHLGPVGSSPRVRGTRTNPEGHGLGTGIIPACAGNTPQD